jgi:Transmembrane protein 43
MSEEYSNDSVTEVTTTGWLQRIVQSFVGAVVAVLLVIGSIVLLWWNEGRAVEAIRALDQGARQLVEANATAVDPANNNMLVHLSGAMTTPAPARDTAFGVGGDDLLRLRRNVEMFQWTEQKSTRSQKNLGGSETTETTYSYHKEWSDHPGRFGSFPRGRRASQPADADPFGND